MAVLPSLPASRPTRRVRPSAAAPAGCGDQPRPISAAEFFRMGAAEVFGPDERLELLGGVIYRMAPPGDHHVASTDWITRLFVRLAGDPERWITRNQNTVRLGRYRAPLPDLALLRPRADYYRDGGLRPADVLLVVEVADSSLTKDRTLKAADYARAGIADYWIINLRETCVEVRRQPHPRSGRYRTVTRATVGQALSPAAFPEVTIPVAELLGPASAARPRRRPGGRQPDPAG